jgi:hypothetical protein
MIVESGRKAVSSAEAEKRFARLNAGSFEQVA